MMKMRLTLLVIVIFFIGCRQKLPEKPNILFITTDYQAWEDTPKLTPVLQMPNLERLSDEGLVFNNHYCTAPVCMPSRYSIVTGTYPHTHGAWDNTNKWVPDDSPILMEELKKAGYRTVGIGKMHFRPWDRMAGFDERIIADAQGNWAGDTLKRDDYYYYLREAGKTRFDYLKYQDSTDIFGVFDWPLDDTLDIDYFVGEETVRYVKDGKLAGPWFLWVSFNGPHNPWDPPARYSEIYLNSDLPSARYTPGELESKPFAHTITRFNYTRKVVDHLDQYPGERDESIRRIRAGHYGGLSWIDEQIGKILDEMDSSGLLENTLVVFSSDHGAHLGDHDNIHKGTHYERSSHVPFIFWWPGVIKKGEFKGFSSHVDIFPTFIDLAGGITPSKVEGKSLLPAMTGRAKASEQAYLEIIGNTSVVNDRYKFGLYRQYREGDLYDRKNDPGEFENLYYKEEYKPVVERLSQQLFDFDPTLREGYESAEEAEDLPTKMVFKYGDVVGMGKGPYLNNSPFIVTVDIVAEEGDNGPVITNHEGPHGFAIYLDKGSVWMAFKTWNNTGTYKIIPGFTPGNLSFKCELTQDGLLRVTGDKGELLSSFETDWPKPYQDGRHEFLTGLYRAGICGGMAVNPIGEYERGKDFSGSINSIKLNTTF